jgi:hypothetical protein
MAEDGRGHCAGRSTGAKMDGIPAIKLGAHIIFRNGRIKISPFILKRLVCGSLLTHAVNSLQSCLESV